MNRLTFVICLHQAVFQAMFLCKNILLKRKLKQTIRGSSLQVDLSILFFVIFIGLAVLFSLQRDPAGTIGLPGESVSMIAALLILSTNLAIAAASLIHLKDSWRVGVLLQQQTDLVTTGIYGISRNPYFVSYILMFLGYSILLHNLILSGLTFAGWLMVHAMIIKEEQYLKSRHGDAYRKYLASVPRYLIF